MAFRSRSLGVVLAAVALGACTANGATREPNTGQASKELSGSTALPDGLPATIVPVPDNVPEQAPRVPSPLAAYRLSEDQNALVYETWQLGMRACMTTQGFDFVVTRYADVSETVRPPTTASDVARYGYDLPPGSHVMFRTTNDQQVEDDSSYRRAFLGDDVDDSTGGCRGSAYVETFEAGHFHTLDKMIEGAMVDASIIAYASDQYKALTLEWSDCMTHAGFDYRAPDEPASRFVGQAISAEEVATRIADLSCQAEVSFERRVSEMENSAALDWIAENQQLLEDAEAARRELVDHIEGYRQQQ